MREVWQWKGHVCIAVAACFLTIDLTFFSANLVKLLDGGWVPLVLAIGTYMVMLTWRRGSIAVAKGMHALTMPVNSFITHINSTGIPRVPGTAVFLSKTTEQTPPLIIWHVTHNRSLHEHIVALSIVITQTPTVSEDQRLTMEFVAPNFWRLIGHYGFMEKPVIPELLKEASQRGCLVDLCDVTYYVGHETILHCTNGSGLPLWQEKIFALMQRNSAQIHGYLSLPHDSVVEIGRQIEI
jgi:KUP system potassium uptake protein